MINKWIGIGNLTRDPDAKTTRNNKSIVTFGIAINNKWIDASGQAQETATFIDCKAFGKVADVIAQYAQKGKQVCIEGHLDLERWTDQGGGQRQKLTVVVDRLELLGGGQSNAPGHHGHYEQQQEKPKYQPPKGDCPF